MKNLQKLLPGQRREPKILAIFSNRREECDRLIRYFTGIVEKSPSPRYPIYVYCLEKPFESDRCEHVVVDPDARRLSRRAAADLTDVWVALSGTSWNKCPRGTAMKLFPLTLPPFRTLAVNENGDIFPVRPLPVVRHWIDRSRQRRASIRAILVTWFEVGVIWPLRHLFKWLRRDLPNTLLWTSAATLSRIPWFDRGIERVIYRIYAALTRKAEIAADISPVATSGPAGSSIARIEYRGDNDWERRRFLPLVQSSRSRFLLFCPPGYTETFDDFLPLFDDPRTFAVTRQTGYREWRRIMFALSPFRSLAPNEAAQVAAPLATAVLVDRDKLQKLPLPRTLVAGAAWLALFRHASGAGWRSYSVGSDAPVPQQEARWVDEALFLKHLFRDERLRRTAPVQPALTRGNIAFRPDLARPYRGLPRVLIVTPYLPFPLSHGGAVRIYNLCRALAGRVDFIYACFREVSDAVDYEELHKIFRRVYVVDRDEINHDPALPERVNHFASSSMRELVATLAKDEAVDLLQIEWTDMAAYRDVAPHVPAILVEHDVTYTLHRQFVSQDSRPEIRQEYERWLNFETRWLRRFDGVFVMSDQDREEVAGVGTDRDRTYVIPNGVDLDRYAPLPTAPENAPEIFYVGTFRHHPNLLGFDELRNVIMPRVWEKFPNAILRVVAGPEHEKHWLNSLKASQGPGAALPQLDPRIVIHGFVADLTPLYAKAHVVVVPLPLSAGTNIKVMEAMACRRAVVTTPVGAQGLGLQSGHDALICALGEDFADAICGLLDAPALRERIAARARTTAEDRFSWKSIAEEMLIAYTALVGQPSGCPAGQSPAL